MNRTELAREIIATYKKHGWQPRRVLLRTDSEELRSVFERELQIRESIFDGIWFSRPSFNEREAWELRLISEQPYALFEAFEADEGEEDREEARREMENKMRDAAPK